MIIFIHSQTPTQQPLKFANSFILMLLRAYDYSYMLELNLIYISRWDPMVSLSLFLRQRIFKFQIIYFTSSVQIQLRYFAPTKIHMLPDRPTGEITFFTKQCHRHIPSNVPKIIIENFNSLQWRQNERHGVSVHQPQDCLLNRVFGRRSKKTPKLCVTGLCEGNSPVTGEFPHRGPVRWKMFPCDNVIMIIENLNW